MLPFDTMILVVGQNSGWQNTFILEAFCHGGVTRVSRVLRTPAGKGSNVVRGIKELGLESILLAYVGGGTGKKFADACLEEGLSCDFVWIEGETRSFVTLVENSGTVSEIIEPSPEVTEKEREGYARRFNRLIRGADVLLVQGTAMQGENPDCYRRYIEEAGEAGVPCVIDSFKEHGRRALFASPEVLKINGDEIKELTGLPFGTGNERRAVFKKVHEEYRIPWIIVTLGAEGVTGSDGTGMFTVTSPHIDAVNTVGSGDAFSAGLGVSLQKDILTGASPGVFPDGFSFSQALIYGTAMGSANCLTLQPGLVKRGDVEDLMVKLKVNPM